MIVQETVREKRVQWVGDRPLTFAEFLEMFGPQDWVELIDGVVVEKNMVQLDHEVLLGWLNRVLGIYVEERRLGIVLGSRTAVEIHEFRGRLPDLLFVRRERPAIVQQKAVYGPPDLVIEVVSPNDDAADIIALETDYRRVPSGRGVAEIVFLDQRRKRVRVLRRQESDYVEEVLTTGTLTLETVEGIGLETDWLFTEPRPNQRATVDTLLARAESAGGN